MEVAVLEVISEALVLLNKVVPDQATRIANKIKDLRERWDVEHAKGELRDDALLDNIRLELRDIRELFSAAIKSAGAASK